MWYLIVSIPGLCTLSYFVWTSLLVLQWWISSNIVCHYLVVLCRLSDMRSALRTGGGGGGGAGILVPLFLWNKLDCSSVPSKFVFSYSLIPNIVFVLLEIWPFFLCSPEINALLPLFIITTVKASYIDPKWKLYTLFLWIAFLLVYMSMQDLRMLIEISS